MPTETTAPLKIRVPLLRPRVWQREVLEAWEEGHTCLVVGVHRRAGKTVLGLTLLILGMLERPGPYGYIAPFFNQGRRILWDSRDHEGRRFLDHFPRPLVRAINETEMQVELRNGSLFQVLGADQPDRLRGLNLFGVCFDEYAVTESSQPWDLVRPILAENGGWACFLSTPNGRNHFWTLNQQAKEDPGWFVTLKTIADTRRDGPGEGGEPIITRA
jgi:phage terminase large subunit